MNINVKFVGTDHYYITTSTELYRVEVPTHAMTLDEAIGIAKDLILHHGFDHADILNGNTGELLVEVNKEEEIDEEASDRYWELGYNPYMGGYDYDC